MQHEFNAERSDVSSIQEKLSLFVDVLKARGFIRDPRVEAAFRTVRRDLFVPDVSWEDAYADETIVTKSLGGETLSSASQPTLMAGVLQQLNVQPGDRVLE